MKLAISQPVTIILLAFLLLVVSVPTVAQRSTDWPRESPPPPLPAKAATFPHYEIRNLDNGLQVVIVKHHEQPSVNLL